MLKAAKLLDPTLIDQAYGIITNIETVSHSSELFCILRKRELSPHFTVGENTCFDFSGSLEPKTGILLNFSENDTHFFNGSLSNTPNHDLNVTVSRPGKESNFSFLKPYNALFINIEETVFKKLFENLTHLDYDRFFSSDLVQFVSQKAKANIAYRIRSLLANEEEDPSCLENLIISIDSTPILNNHTFCNALATAAHHILMATKDRTITLSELSEILRAPARSIQHGFKNVYGMGPIDFHIHYRMQCVRNFIRTHKIGHGDLTQIALIYGFNHQGRFAQNYRKAFGILPSKESHL